jgi:predicted HicB family RNase H-like nuclease
MGKTSATVKNRYNDKAYDRINVVVPKGYKETIKAYANDNNMSVNAFILNAIKNAIKDE